MTVGRQTRPRGLYTVSEGRHAHAEQPLRDCEQYIFGEGHFSHPEGIDLPAGTPRRVLRAP